MELHPIELKRGKIIKEKGTFSDVKGCNKEMSHDIAFFYFILFSAERGFYLFFHI